MHKTFITAEIRELLDELQSEKITLSRFTEILNMKKQEQIDQLRMRIDRIEQHLGVQYNASNFSKSNLSEKPNSCEYEQPDFIPDWKDAPEWAKYAAMDKDGFWCWFDKIPYITDSDIWIWQDFSNKKIVKPEATNAYRLHPDYWKTTLTMRPEAVIDEPEAKPTDNQSDQQAHFNRIHNWNKYHHLLPDGYEFCEEGEHEKLVKVERKGVNGEYPIGHICRNNVFIGTWKPIRQISYHVAVHEVIDSTPDPYQVDWAKAPEWADVHCFDEDGTGWWGGCKKSINSWGENCSASGFTLPSGLDWKQSKRRRPV